MLTSIVNTNLLGTLFGCREALRIMIKQNYGHIINVAGRGTNGESSENILAYGATKRSLDSIHKSLQKELKQTNIGIHLVSPGMVLTDLLIRENTPIKTKKIFNILAEHPTYVAMKLVPKIRNLHGSGKKISFLDNKKAFFRFITAFRYKNKFFDSNGNLKVNINPVDKI
jgi:NAD(P)-dependent dehydrogenase (short-subunit alcohol dehydrogenase family)